MNLEKVKKYNIYNAKWYHFVYVWLYNLFHKQKKSCTKDSWVKSVVMDNLEKGLSYPYIKTEMDDLKDILKEFGVNLNESNENVEK